MFVLGDITKALRVLLVVPAPFLADAEDKHRTILEFVSKGLMLLTKLWQLTKRFAKSTRIAIYISS